MAFADASFDVAVAMYTASVVPDARKLFSEMSRVVRPGGQLIVVGHFAAENGPRWWLERSMSPLARWLGWHPDFALRDLLDPEVTPIEAMEPCSPFGIFTVLQVPNNGIPQHRLQPAAA
jgi:phosphatidylethanolamine/phosphatidyl-N-methylethanolamine N-methyltransferase